MSNPMATPVPWDLVAGAYAEEIVPMFERYARDALRLAAPTAGGRIVDVACGPGTLSFLAAAQGLGVDAIDFSPAMIARFEARLHATSTPGIAVRAGDGQALPYADATFDAGFSMFGLMFFPDRAKGFAELRRVLKPGARAVVSSWVRLEDSPVLAAMFGALRETMAKVLGPNAPAPGAQEMPLTTPDACRAEMSSAFADVEVHPIAHAVTYPSYDEVWGSIERTMAPMVLMRKNLGEERWAPISDAARIAITKALAGGPPELEMKALLSVGTVR